MFTGIVVAILAGTAAGLGEGAEPPVPNDGIAVHTRAFVIEQPGSSPQLTFALLDSLPPQGSGPELVGWDWSAPVRGSSYGGVRWTDAPVEIQGLWLDNRLHVMSVTAPESGSPVLESHPTDGCSEEDAWAILRDIGSELEEAGLRDIYAAHVAIDDGYCGAEIVALHPWIDDIEQAREILASYDDRQLRLVYQIAPIDSELRPQPMDSVGGNTTG